MVTSMSATPRLNRPRNPSGTSPIKAASIELVRKAPNFPRPSGRERNEQVVAKGEDSDVDAGADRSGGFGFCERVSSLKHVGEGAGDVE